MGDAKSDDIVIGDAEPDDIVIGDAEPDKLGKLGSGIESTGELAPEEM